MYLFGLEFCLNIGPWVGLLDHTAILFLVFWEYSILFSIVATPTYIPTNSVKGSHFSTSLPTFVICLLFDNSHSEIWGDILLWFWFTFPWCLRYWVSFYAPDGHLDFFRKYIVSSSACFFFLMLIYKSYLYMLDIHNPILYQSYHLPIFSPIH